MSYSPIALFVYNRLAHTKLTVEALRMNPEHADSDLIIFSDAPKVDLHHASVLEVREYLKTITGFQSVRIVERDVNYGLARSIVEGVTEVVNKYGRVIVVEDDVVTSSSFLCFMNRALDYYSDTKEVWHISGWSYPIESEGLGDVFCWKVMNCWGWATWGDRWRFFNKNPGRLIKEWDRKKVKDFDLDGSGVFWRQIKANYSGRSNTWAVFWYSTIYENSGLCVNPSVSFVDNVGMDGSGSNSHASERYSTLRLNNKRTFCFERDVVENTLALERVKKYYKSVRPSFLLRLKNKLASLTVRR